MTDDVQSAPEPSSPAPEAAAPEAPPETSVAEVVPEAQALTAESVPEVVKPVIESELQTPTPSEKTTSASEVVVEPTTEAPQPASVSSSVSTPPSPAPSGHQLDQEERRRGNSKRLQHREENLEKILELARAHEWITNDMVEKVLHVSNASVHRYLNMLVVRGKLWREGKGRGVRYRIV